MANWLRKLMPQQEKFFPLFNDHAAKVEQAAIRLCTVLESDRHAESGELDRHVAEGRGAATKILDQIRQSFVTPFDRSDIKEMTASMQSLLEDMRSIARTRRHASGVKLAAFSSLILECAGELKAGVALLEDFDKRADDLRRMRDKIGGLRIRMLALREDAMVELLAQGAGDPMATLAASRLLQRVSDLVERFDDVADHIDDLVLDHV